MEQIVFLQLLGVVANAVGFWRDFYQRDKNNLDHQITLLLQISSRNLFWTNLVEIQARPNTRCVDFGAKLD